jgi:hypothetical protein
MSEAQVQEGAPRTHLVIGTPCFGGNVSHHYMISMINLQAACIERGIVLTFNLLGGDSLIPRARNTILTEFIESPTATHLLFVDADIGFQPEQVFSLLDIDKDIAGAVYPLKNFDWELIRTHIESGRESIPAGTLSYVVEFIDSDNVPVVNGFAKVRYLGTGFMMIKRQALERMTTHYPQLKFRAAHTNSHVGIASENRYALFDCVIEPETGFYLSEDYTFCKRWTDIGGEIWADLDSKLTHVGPYAFHGDLMRIFNPPAG